ncbi:hypothetical protein ECH7EC4206_A5306 [Escherichia coli O157:H7 str. EC4206]|nr:hypothetical protein ECH7EC4206_A5306 [Escherichia coli O157:H7 str. EC4206]
MRLVIIPKYAMNISNEITRLNPSPGDLLNINSTDIFGLCRAPLAM